MSDAPSVLVQACLDRLRQGDDAAREDLFAIACERLRRLTRRMLNDFRELRRWEETGDVFQNAMLRLCRALGAATPGDVRTFYRLAALQIRRELIDLTRHHYGPEGGGANHATWRPGNPESSTPAPLEPADRSGEPARLAAWTEFHTQAGRLPEDEREVLDLLWYQGLKQEEAAAVLGVSVRTIKSRWRSARLQLVAALGGEMPAL